MKTKVKICCISSLDEMQMAVGAGASAVGLVSAMPSGPGPIAEELIAKIASQTPSTVQTFLLTSLQETNAIIAQHFRLKTTTLQIVDRLENGSYQDLREALPKIQLVQVIHVNGMESVEEALAISEQVDALLLDSGNQNLLVKELGGTGRTHDWTLSQKICEQSSNPVFLAGGLNAENVRSAIEQVQPFGVDICSGVRTGGKLDAIKLEKFMSEINSI